MNNWNIPFRKEKKRTSKWLFNSLISLQIIREGDPVPRMVFIVRGRIKRNQSLSKGIVATSVLEPGGFLGDELLSWCLRRPFIDRLPASSATFICLESTEAFGLDAQNLRYITDHFRYKFANERLKRTARYYSSNWRTWAAVNIQLAYRRYRQRTRGPVTPVRDNGGSERRLLQYAAMFMSIRPHDHLEWWSLCNGIIITISTALAVFFHNKKFRCVTAI